MSLEPDRQSQQAPGQHRRTALLAAALLVAAAVGLFFFRSTRDQKVQTTADPRSAYRSQSDDQAADSQAAKTPRDAMARRERNTATAEQRAHALLQVKRGEVGMIAISAEQFATYFRTMLPQGAWSEMAGAPATLVSRKAVSEALRSALGDGASLKASFSPGGGSEYAGNNLEVKIGTMEVYEGYSEIQTEIVSGTTTVSTTLTLPEGALMMFRSRDNPPSGMLLVTPARER